MKNMKKRGFTIVELVIVIAVIAILAAVLIPTFSNVIEKANESNALQAARNAWTCYQAENAQTFSSKSGYIKFVDKSSKATWFEVKDGQFQPTVLTTSTTPSVPTTYPSTSGTDAYTSITSSNIDGIASGITIFVK